MYMHARLSQKSLFILLKTVIFCLCFSLAASAATFDLSYQLTEGGSVLELSPEYSSKGVKIEISSNISTHYEVVQQLISPLQSKNNPGFILRDCLVFRGLRGTNRYGDLRVPVDDSPVGLEDVLYVSNPTGNADSFILVYGLANTEELLPGYYTAKIAFVLNPIGSARPPVTRILDISVNVSQGPGEKPVIEISAEDGAKNIFLSNKTAESGSAEVLVKLNGRFRSPFSISQYLISPLESAEGRRLGNTAVNFVIQEAKKGMAINKLTPLSGIGIQTIYSSLPNGESDSHFIISYRLGDLSQNKAGNYRSRIQYFLDEKAGQTKLETLDIEVENPRIFDLSVSPGEKAAGIEFRDIRPDSENKPVQSEVLIEINTNIGQRYQVNQEVYADLTNKEGQSIPAEYFIQRLEDLSTKGTLKINQWQPVRKGSTLLFISDNHGSSDRFKAVYQLQPPKDIKAGSYFTTITYTLLEI
ncbi:MAG: hypothetical protein NC914_01025 [Candidatus Omnitrophica bacterium]|nr:hypothetical protein [Candidatus Omnitrophota bacterium]